MNLGCPRDNLDHELTDLDFDGMTRWYVLETYAREEEEYPLLSDGAYDKLHTKIVLSTVPFREEWEGYISVPEGEIVIHKYPKVIKSIYKEVRKACDE